MRTSCDPNRLRLSELARQGKLERMMTLVEFGCDVNAIDYDRRSPLYAAAGNCNVNVIDFLLAKKANVNATDFRGCTPLDEAVRTNHQLVAQRLREVCSNAATFSCLCRTASLS